jgi:hypothetical protein
MRAFEAKAFRSSGVKFFAMRHHSDSLRCVQRIALDTRVSDTLEPIPMETKGERRLRKLKALCVEHGGHTAVADHVGISEQYLDQILKGVRLPTKADGTRSPRTLGDAAARKIEHVFQLGEGWFDTDEHWPIPYVDQARYERLKPEDQLYVQAKMMAAIEERESGIKLPAVSPVARKVAAKIDAYPEEERQILAAVAKRAIDVYLKERKADERTTASSRTPPRSTAAPIRGR